ncbi:hypothetical protein SteCoe_2505 [Stentor coeruleus]|uniref:Uncharacterized protein n=1 Tax=Stentor coeruleus TaxID=5963 RepID=A0A1R2CZ71_9CILI|nr:hypothetical protein SteCoe_2505 [Stentor coeruleus]
MTKLLISNSDFYQVSDLYKSNPNNYYSRIQYSDTNLTQHADLTNTFISNLYYSTKESALLLGLCECLVRTNYNEILLKIADNFIQKSQQTKDFKDIYKLLWENGIQSSLLKLKLASKFVDYELDSVYSMQNFANTFNLGVSVKNFNSDKGLESFTILPENPQIIPVPIIQLGKFKNYVFCLYSDDVNALDGFDTKGNLSKSSEIDLSSKMFRAIENKENSAEFIEIIENLSQVLLESLKSSCDKTKINQIIENIETKIRAKSQKSLKFQKSLKILTEVKFQLTNNPLILLDQDLPPNLTKNSNPPSFPKPSQSNSHKPKIPSPNMQNNFNPNILNSKNLATPIVNPQSRFLKPDISYPVNSQISFKPIQQNYIQNSPIQLPSQKSYAPSIPNQQNLTNKGGKNVISNQPYPLYSPYNPPVVAKLEKCIGCEKNKLCITIHSNCRLCQGCIYKSLSQKIARCAYCGANIENIRSDIILRISFSCDKCKQKTKNFDFLECGCIICKKNCKSDNHVCQNR